MTVSIKASLSFGLILALISVASALGPAAVNLGTAANYTILAQTTITNTGATSITGSIGLTPAASTLITGFTLTLGPGGVYATSPNVASPGKVYAASYNDPTPAQLTLAKDNMGAAYTDAAGRPPPNNLNYMVGNINGPVTLTPNLYKWTTGVTINGIVTLSGSATDTFIFQISGTLNLNSGAQILLSGGLVPKNVFWQVTGAITFGTTSKAKGIFLGKTGISLMTGASLNGRALAQTAVTFQGNAVTQP